MNKLLKYKALVLDHDDTVVASTQSVHYPAFVKAINQIRPGHPVLSLMDFQKMNLNPGLISYYREVLAMSDEEILREETLWREFAKGIVPQPYPFINDILLKYTQHGGLIFVSSLNYLEIIQRDYLAHFPQVVLTDVFCKDQYEELIKPNPQQLFEIMATYDLNSNDILMVDDLQYGLQMAQQAQVDFAYAQYSQISPHNHRYFKQQAQIILNRPEELEQHLYL